MKSKICLTFKLFYSLEKPVIKSLLPMGFKKRGEGRTEEYQTANMT